MCQKLQEQIEQDIDNIEILHDADDTISNISENTHYFIMCINEELNGINNNKFLDPVELIKYFKNRLHLEQEPEEIFMDLENIEHKTSLLLIIVFLKKHLILTIKPMLYL